MNQDLLIGADGDLVLRDGDLVLTVDTPDEAQATAQRLQTRLRLFLGEWFLNTAIGAPWLQSILGKKGSKDVADAAIKTTALGVPNVAAINEFSSNSSSGRRYSASLRAQTASGPEVTAQV